jgi:hypothetical protein
MYNMTVPQLPSFIEQQTVRRDHLPALPQPQVETYLTGRFTQLHILQHASTKDLRWSHYAEVATTTREWVPILTTALEHHDEAEAPKVPAKMLGKHDGPGAPIVPAGVLGQYDERGAPDVPAEMLGQYDEPGAPNVPAEVLERHDEPGAPNVPAEVLGRHNASGVPNAPAELHVNGVVYHRSTYDRSGEEQG